MLGMTCCIVLKRISLLLLIIALLVHFSFSPSKFSVTNFLASMRARVFKFCIHIESGQVYCGTENKTDIYFAFFLLFFISHSNVIHREICDKYFLGLLHVGFYNLVQVDYGKENQVSVINFCLLFPFFLFSISHSNVIHREICVKDFSGTTVPRILKFGTNVGYDLLYCVKENQHAALIFPLIYPFFFLSKQIFCYKFLSFDGSQSLQILYWEWPGILWDRKQNRFILPSFSFFHFSNVIHVHREICDKYFSGTIARRIL